MGYNFTTAYKKGKENKVADALSRREEVNAGTLSMITFPTPEWIEELKHD